MIEELNIKSDEYSVINKINEIIKLLNKYEEDGILTQKDIRELRNRMFPEHIVLR